MSASEPTMITQEQKAECLAALRTVSRIVPKSLVDPLVEWVVAQHVEEALVPERSRRYTLPCEAPRVEEHLGVGPLPQALRDGSMWAGYHYTLTPGQRRWFREVAGMTPARTVTIAWVERFVGTQHPRSFKIVSDEHVDPRRRSHVLVEFVVKDAGEFFETATGFDKEGEESSSAVGVRATIPGSRKTAATIAKSPSESVADLLAELERGYGKAVMP